MMAGAALYISNYQKTLKGITWLQNFKHIAIRCGKLFICGTALHCVYAGKLVVAMECTDTVIRYTIIAYLIIRKSVKYQIIFSISLLLLTEALYRFMFIPGYDQSFTEHHNFGAWMDTVLMGKINSDGWVAINFIPTAAHTIWGVLAGKSLISNLSSRQKITQLLIVAVIGLATGFGLDITNITPIIKRFSTSSFVLASGGLVLVTMSFLYWFNDVKKQNKNAWIFTAVGINSIFIYLFFETVGMQWVNAAVGIFVCGFGRGT